MKPTLHKKNRIRSAAAKKGWRSRKLRIAARIDEFKERTMWQRFFAIADAWAKAGRQDDQGGSP